MGYSRKKKNQKWVVEPYVFQKIPGILGLSLYAWLGNSGENKASLQDIPQNCTATLGNSKTRKQDPWKFHMIVF